MVFFVSSSPLALEARQAGHDELFAMKVVWQLGQVNSKLLAGEGRGGES
jgi:hypothetical protein